jgi:predicted thioredoxin/glutaredoxin
MGDPPLFEIVFDGMLSDDPLIRMRSADAIEKITAKRPEYLQPYKEKLIKQIAKSEQQEVRWHWPISQRRIPICASR